MSNSTLSNSNNDNNAINHASTPQLKSNDSNAINSNTNTIHQDSLLAHTEHKPDEQEQLMGSLGNHYGFVWSNYHIIDLPFIIYDNGFHFYANEKSLEEGGLFKIAENKAGKHDVFKVGTLKPEKPQLDLSITNFVFFEFITVAILSLVFMFAKNSYSKAKEKAPSGLQNVLEHIILWVRDTIVRPNLPSRKIADKLTPYFTCLFFFILTLNYIGMLPGAHTATSAMEVTGALALLAFIVINFNAVRMGGLGHFLKHLLGGAPIAMAPLMIPLEIIGMLIKPIVLTLRLFANMTAGHLILTSLVGVIIISKMILAAVPIVPFSVFIMLLEVLVCLIQAFIFTLLTVIFTGLAIGEHPKEKFSDGHHSHVH